MFKRQLVNRSAISVAQEYFLEQQDATRNDLRTYSIEQGFSNSFSVPFDLIIKTRYIFIGPFDIYTILKSIKLVKAIISNSIQFLLLEIW